MDQSSPESSPILSSRPSSYHKRISVGGIEPSLQHWQMMSGLERNSGGIAVSIPSSDSSSEDGPETNDNSDRDDQMLMTPQASKSENSLASPGNEFLKSFRGTTSSLMGYRQTARRSRRPSAALRAGSLSGTSAMSPTSMLVARDGGPRFTAFKRAASSLATIDNNNPSTPDSGDSQMETQAPVTAFKGLIDAGVAVIQRPVSRRGNMLPKSRGFARIRATLMEESAPVESESRRESEVIRQVKEREGPPVKPQSASMDTETSHTSTDTQLDDASNSFDDNTTSCSPNTIDSRSRRSSFLLSRPSFSSQAKRLSGGKEFWQMMERTHTPPPLLRQRDSSAGTDMLVDSPAASTPSSMSLVNSAPNTDLAQAADSYSSHPNSRHGGPSIAELSRMANGKRKRDDSDLDVASIKRRAVSPSLSAQQSPILGSGPFGRAERQNSGGGTIQGTKKVGLSGMVDTNDAIMKMSIG